MFRNFLTYRLFCGSLETLVIKISNLIEDPEQSSVSYLSCLNPHSVAVASRNSAFEIALKKATFVVPDGIGCVIGAMLMGLSPIQKITGFDVFVGLSKHFNSLGAKRIKVFFLGSNDATLEIIKEKYKIDFKNIEIVGSYSPPYSEIFTELEELKMVENVNCSGADILWVGLSSPKQDMWIANNLENLDVSFAAGIGAVFDFYSGSVRRSPRILQNLGLEWLYRLWSEPRRLWRRTFVSVPIYLVLLFRELIKRVNNYD